MPSLLDLSSTSTAPCQCRGTITRVTKFCCVSRYLFMRLKFTFGRYLGNRHKMVADGYNVSEYEGGKEYDAARSNSRRWEQNIFFQQLSSEAGAEFLGKLCHSCTFSPLYKTPLFASQLSKLHEQQYGTVMVLYAREFIFI